MKRKMRHYIVCSVLALLLAVSAYASPILGPTLTTFTVLGHETVTNVPTSVITGNVGAYAGTALTGFTSVVGGTATDPQVTGGLVHSTTAQTAAAQVELTAAIGYLNSLPPGTTLGVDLVGLTLNSGVYTVPAGSPGTSNLTGKLVLDGQGNANAYWVFLMENTLITSSGSEVSMINTDLATAGLFWDVRSSATIGSGSTFLGNILALASVGMDTKATDNCGRALASTAAVTLEMNTLSGYCSGLPAGPNGLSGGLEYTPETGVTFLPYAPYPAIPEPGTVVLLGTGIACLVAGRLRSARRRQRDLASKA